MTLADERKAEMFDAVQALNEHLGSVLGIDDYDVNGTAAGEYLTVDIAVEDILDLMERGIL